MSTSANNNSQKSETWAHNSGGLEEKSNASGEGATQTPLEPLDSRKAINWQNLGAELVFIQDSSLRYLSFYWQAGANYGLDNERVIGTLAEQLFTPVALESYREKIERVLERQIPEQCHWQFKYDSYSFAFELVISPILPSSGKASSVMIMGHLLNEEVLLTPHPSLPTYPDPYQKLLTQIAQKIRHTSDIETIRQQTADSLGELLKVSRCLILDYSPNTQKLEVKADYRQKSIKPLLGYEVSVETEAYLKQAVNIKEPITLDWIDSDIFEQQSVLAIATCYQEQCNGLIVLGCDRHCHWSLAEIELVRELAAQLGTAIAHATIYQELEQATLKAEEASRLKSEFLASTTHELRTPLNGILGFLKLILDGMAEDPEEQQEFLDQAYHSALHLLNLINDVLDIAKIEAGKMEIELTTVSLNELFHDVEKFARTQAENKQLYLKIKLPATYEQIMIYGNYQRLLQVLLNLVSNAIKFTHEGGVTISAEIVQKKVERHNQEFPGLVKVSVADTGIGVSLEKQDKLFEKFFQADGSRTKAYGGTGLGLAISHKLIEAMGGKVSFYSMGEGLGSTVTFTVPLNYIPVMKTVESDGQIELVS